MATAFASFRGYQHRWLRRDLIAGLTVWAVLIPESLAYATIAGASPVVGLYAAVPALLLYPIVGTSRHLVVGPMSATAALSAGVVGGFATAGSVEFLVYTSGLAIAVGVLALLAGALRLGFLASFISEPVLKGFIIGMALIIILGQVPKLIGVERGEGNFFSELGHVVVALDDMNGWTLAVGTTALALILMLRRLAPGVPASLVAVALGIIAVASFDLSARGVSVVGPIDAGLPEVGVPEVAAGDIPLLLSGAAGVMLVGFVEGLGAAKTYAQRGGYRVDANRELIGLGSASLGAGLFSGMVVNGSLSKTAVNGNAGAKSQVSGWVVALLTVVALIFLTSLFEQLPEAVLAAVVIAAVIELVDLAALRRLYRLTTVRLESIYGRATRADFLGAVTALFGVLCFDTLPGLIIGVVTSVLLLIYRVSRPHLAELGRVPGRPGQWSDLDRYADNEIVPGIVVVRVESGLFFANADHVRDGLSALARPGVHALIVDAAAIPVIDTTAADMLRDLASELHARGVTLTLVGDIGQVRDVLRTAEPHIALGRTFSTIDTAVAECGSDHSGHGDGLAPESPAPD